MVTQLALAIFSTLPESARARTVHRSLPHAIHRTWHNAQHMRLDQRPDAVISNEISLELPHKCSTQRRADRDGVEFGAVDDNGIQRFGVQAVAVAQHKLTHMQVGA